MSAEGEGGRFAWLLDEGTKRRGNLRAVRMALDAGRLDACARLELAEVLAALRRDGGLTGRERARLDDVADAIDQADARDPALRPIRLARARA